MRGLLQPFLVVVVTLTQATASLACPLSATGTGDAVRAGIANDFLVHVGATAAPFVVFFAIVTIVQRGWPPWSGGA